VNASDPFKKYAEQVCEQIRWKKAHDIVAQEIENHLIDQKNAYMDMGDSESTSEEKALLQMGDPVAVGAALDGTHKPAAQWGMMGLVMVLFLIGAIIQFLFLDHMLMDTDFQGIGMNSLIIFLPVSLAVFFMAYFLDFSFFGKHPFLLPGMVLAIDILALFFGVQSVGRNWLMIGGFAISPISISALFPFAFCGLLYHLREKGIRGYFIGGIIAVVFCLQLLLWHTAGGLILFLFSAGILMVFAASRNWFGQNAKHILVFFVIAALLMGCVLLFAVPEYTYRLSRLVSALHPEADPHGAGYLPNLLQTMLENAVILGHGAPVPGIPMENELFLINFRSDYLLTHLTYQYGWAVSAVLVLLLAVFLILGFRKCLKQKSILGQMTSLSILSTFAGEILIYVITNLGYPLIAPISLPFLSYGTTGLILHMFLAGILLSAFRTGEVYRDNRKSVVSESKFIQWDDGKLIISLKG